MLLIGLFSGTSTSVLYTLSLHDALPISLSVSNWRAIRQRPAPSAARTAISRCRAAAFASRRLATFAQRSEEHTSELQSRGHLVCRLLLEKKKKKKKSM